MWWSNVHKSILHLQSNTKLNSKQNYFSVKIDTYLAVISLCCVHTLTELIQLHQRLYLMATHARTFSRCFFSKLIHFLFLPLENCKFFGALVFLGKSVFVQFSLRRIVVENMQQHAARTNVKITNKKQRINAMFEARMRRLCTSKQNKLINVFWPKTFRIY